MRSRGISMPRYIIVCIFFVSLVVTLSACAERQKPPPPPGPTISETCQSYGYMLGTHSYGKCMDRETKLALERQQVSSEMVSAGARVLSAMSDSQPAFSPPPQVPVWNPPAFSPLPVTAAPITTNTQCYGAASLINCNSTSY